MKLAEQQQTKVEAAEVEGAEVEVEVEALEAKAKVRVKAKESVNIHWLSVRRRTATTIAEVSLVLSEYLNEPYVQHWLQPALLRNDSRQACWSMHLVHSLLRPMVEHSPSNTGRRCRRNVSS